MERKRGFKPTTKEEAQEILKKLIKKHTKELLKLGWRPKVDKKES